MGTYEYFCGVEGAGNFFLPLITTYFGIFRSGGEVG